MDAETWAPMIQLSLERAEAAAEMARNALELARALADRVAALEEGNKP